MQFLFLKKKQNNFPLEKIFFFKFDTENSKTRIVFVKGQRL